jgi:hypothetical protein
MRAAIGVAHDNSCGLEFRQPIGQYGPRNTQSAEQLAEATISAIHRSEETQCPHITQDID